MKTIRKRILENTISAKQHKLSDSPILPISGKGVSFANPHKMTTESRAADGKIPKTRAQMWPR